MFTAAAALIHHSCLSLICELPVFAAAGALIHHGCLSLICDLPVFTAAGALIHHGCLSLGLAAFMLNLHTSFRMTVISGYVADFVILDFIMQLFCYMILSILTFCRLLWSQLIIIIK